MAMSPLFTDLPIILISLFIFSRLSEINIILAVISFVGGGYIIHLAIDALKVKELNIEVNEDAKGSIRKGIITNFLSPNAYLFWATVGAPNLYKALEINLLTAILFLVSFYTFLIGSKIGIAFIVAKTKHFINQKYYVYIMRFFGIALLVFAGLFFWEGMSYLT